MGLLTAPRPGQLSCSRLPACLLAPNLNPLLPMHTQHPQVCGEERRGGRAARHRLRMAHRHDGHRPGAHRRVGGVHHVLRNRAHLHHVEHSLLVRRSCLLQGRGTHLWMPTGVALWHRVPAVWHRIPAPLRGSPSWMNYTCMAALEAFIPAASQWNGGLNCSRALFLYPAGRLSWRPGLSCPSTRSTPRQGTSA